MSNNSVMKKIINEWNTFLNEGIKEKFTEENIGSSVKINVCCKFCEKFTELDRKKSYDGILSGINGNDVDLGSRKENTVFVKLNNKDKMIPQCCVSLNEKPNK